MNHIEDAVGLIKTAIQSQIGAILTTVAAGYTDGLVLASPAKYYINEVFVLDPTMMPACQIIPESTDTAIPANKWDEDTDYITIIVHNISSDGIAENLSKISYRWAKALSILIQNNHTLTTNAHGWSRVSINYGAIWTDGTLLKQQLVMRTKLLTIRTV